MDAPDLFEDSVSKFGTLPGRSIERDEGGVGRSGAADLSTSANS